MPRSAIRLRGLSLFALTIALSGGASAWAQSAAPSIAAAPEVADDTIIVTGTRRTDRTVAESAVPIDVFTPAELKTQASGDIKVIVRNLVPSFNLSRNATADGSAFVRPPTLRGLPADQVLVLINGKRFHRSALVQVNGASLNAGSQGPDLSQIPTAAIERLEVLRDGASAQYGSDAIAGVLNFTLRRNDEGLDLSSRYGQYYRGDGKDIQLSANAGFKLGDGFLNVTGEFSDVGDTNRAVQRPDAIVLQSLGFNPKEPVTRVGQPDLRAYRLFFNSAIPLGDDEVYAFGNYGWSDQVIDFNYRRPIRVVTTDIPGRPGSGVFAKSINTTYLDRNADGTWNELGRTFETSQLFPDGFTPRFRSTNLDLSLVAGYRGETDFGLSFDASAAYGQNRIRYFLSDTLNPSLGPDSPTSFYAGALEQRETNLNLDLTYPVEVGLASPLNIAGGLEYRREGFLIGLGERASWEQGIYATQTVRRADGTTFLSTKPVGSNGFPGYGPSSVVDDSRTSVASYLDLEADVTDGLTLGVAGRYENYSDFGGTFNAKASARWAPNDLVALRGAVSTGFRAPTPGQLFLRNLQTVFLPGNPLPVQIATLSPEDAAAQYYGAEPLKPEKSLSFSGGGVLTPGGGFNLTVDYYNITVRDRIGLTGNITVSDAFGDRAALTALGVVDAASLGQVRYFTNGFKTRTQGVDIVLTHRGDVGPGSLNSSLALNYNRTRVLERRQVVLAKLRPADTRVITLIDDVRKTDIEGILPRWRAVAASTFSTDRFDFTARANYHSSFTVGATTANGGDKTFGGELSFDFEAGATFNEVYRVAIGLENAFNRYPDRETRGIFPTIDAPGSGNRYPDASPLGYQGGFWYVRVGARF